MKRIGLIVSIVSLTFSIVIFYWYSVSKAGVYTYPLDDAYIHLAISKNLALFDTWGITKHEFSSTSSSPLFTICLALLIKVFGVHDSLPLAFNLVLLIPFYYFLNKLLKPYNTFVYSIGMILSVLIPIVHIQVVTGMEHMMQLVLVTSTLHFFNNYLKEDRPLDFIYLLVSSLLLVACRYEELFLVFALCIILFSVKKLIRSIVLGLFSLIPVILYGLYSLNHGAGFFPNSLLIKGNTSVNALQLLSSLINNIVINPYLIFVILGCSYLLILSYSSKNSKNLIDYVKENWLNIAVLISVFFHSVFAKFGWYYRYDAYLKLIAILALIPLIETVLMREFKTKKWLFSTFVFSGFLLFSSVLVLSSYLNMAATKNIFEQQVQIAKFLNKNYNTSTVLANDIGAISYYSDIRLIDAIGLGTNDVQKIRSQNEVTTNGIMEDHSIIEYVTSRNPEIAVLYDYLSESGMPKGFYKVGTWTIENNVICGSDSVSFYAFGKQNINSLKERLQMFGETELDRDVKYKIF